MTTEGDENITPTPEPVPETTETPEPVPIPVQAPRRVSKGEKKFKKAMNKMGMKPVDGITRVTLKTLKNYILYIDNPEVMKAPGAETAYIVFGEAKFLDFTKNAAASQLDKFKAPQEATPAQPTEGGDGETGGEDVEISEDTIETLIEYTSCEREAAIEALKSTNGDLVEAISKLS